MAAHPDEPIFEAQGEAQGPLLVSTQHQPLISNEKLKQLYTDMLRTRQRGKTRSSSRARRQTWKFLEASLVATTIDLRTEDSVISSSDLPIDTIAQRAVLDRDSVIALATGAALLHRAQAKSNVVIAFVDARPSARNRQFLRIAHKQSLPIVYVEIEETLPKTARTRTDITSIPVDKADVVAIYRVASEAIDKARRGAGPTLIQCVPFSLKKTPSTNHHSQDPIRYMEYYLRKKNLWR
ncbi:MAG TPA: thiamine pyrophosphate-dependent enzyme [Terriglobales bacterium]|nr:thiamine pyrophosphate-dependent enzyme [Terriglobales bacterium]